MAIATNIRADSASASGVERLWDQVAAFEDEPSMRALGYRPHFTFAIYDAPEVEEETARRAMLRAAMHEAQLRIEFRRIRWFVGPPLILWAEPAANEALARLHASVSAAIDPAHCRSHYRLRAITQSAFSIGLLQYCRKQDTPHPGFVLLDSPLLSYKEPDGEDDDLRHTDLKQRFYHYLQRIDDGQQVIIIENTDPPADVQTLPQAIRFTGNPVEGRAGLFSTSRS